MVMSPPATIPRNPNIVPSAIAAVWLSEPEDEPEICEGVPDESPGAVPDPPPEFGIEPVCVDAGNEVKAGVEPGEGAV